MGSGMVFANYAKSSVLFDKPFVWSVTQLVWFFRDHKMDQLLTGPGTQQQPL